jgi:hypothetical protein
MEKAGSELGWPKEAFGKKGVAEMKTQTIKEKSKEYLKRRLIWISEDRFALDIDFIKHLLILAHPHPLKGWG